MRMLIGILMLALAGCATPRQNATPATLVTVSEHGYAVGGAMVKSRAELADALINLHASLVALRLVGKPDYQQVEQAVQAVRDAGGHFDMVGAEE